MRLGLGHMDEKGMQLLSKKGILFGVKIANLEFCEHCVMGKKHRLKFSRGAHITKVLDISIHRSNCWGPSRVEGMGGYRYFVSFVDDKSKKLMTNTFE